MLEEIFSNPNLLLSDTLTKSVSSSYNNVTLRFDHILGSDNCKCEYINCYFKYLGFVIAKKALNFISDKYICIV